jgi:predicted outer membrane repeat protein
MVVFGVRSKWRGTYLVLALSSIVLSSCLPSSLAQDIPSGGDLCPEFEEIDPLQECTTIESYGVLKEIVESLPSGGSVDLCPFFVQKVSTLPPIVIRKGVTVKCVRRTPDDLCIINGRSYLLYIDTSEDTLWQGMSFRGSDDYAVYIVGEAENSEFATHTFCQSSFEDNIRYGETRGGALMAESDGGTINVVQSFFSDNFSQTYGAAIYSRAKQLNVIDSIFLRNKANGYGGAIFTSSGANLMIKGSSFLSNRGREEHDIVFNPSKFRRCFVRISFCG